MSYQGVFRRYELKYLLTLRQRDAVLSAMAPYMVPDRYGNTTIRNLYFDTHHYRLIRRSLEKPIYKEKLRIRSYQKATENSTVFVELKKKYDHVVYKRRLPMTEKEAMEWVCQRKAVNHECQIFREIEYFLNFYGDLLPTVYLSYDREAYVAKDQSDFRVTFDERILARTTDLTLESEPYGISLLEEGYVLMEIKCAGGMPLWMSHVLNREGVYKTSFSKYGTAYTRLILPNQITQLKTNKERIVHA